MQIVQTIFADDSYSKPYFVTYINSSFFSVLLLLVGARRLRASGGSIRGAIRGQGPATLYLPISEVEDEQAPLKPDNEEGNGTSSQSPQNRLLIEEPLNMSGTIDGTIEGRLDIRETAWLSFEFCILWVRIPNLTVSDKLS